MRVEYGMMVTTAGLMGLYAYIGDMHALLAWFSCFLVEMQLALEKSQRSC